MDYERQRRRQQRRHQAIRSRVLAALVLLIAIVGAVLLVKGCKGSDIPDDERQDQPAVDVMNQEEQQQQQQTTLADPEDELLTLVNPWNTLPDDWEMELVTLEDGRKIDSRCADALNEMMEVCREAGYDPLICSAYRTQDTQQSLYDNKVSRLMATGMDEETAKVEAAKAVAIPGTSEHQLGLAVDIVDYAMQDLTDEQENTETQKWLMANSWRYGFIHRYPSDKTDITGIIYEPWHYRYVGKDAAQDIFSRDITLEEYLGKAEH